ncbi:hypothetical protein TNCV_1030441 [Trichonephila clavipes]|nr:hypothetical protein TNCV_1030441 [Trichonephila clavipes]
MIDEMWHRILKQHTITQRTLCNSPIAGRAGFYRVFYGLAILFNIRLGAQTLNLQEGDVQSRKLEPERTLDADRIIRGDIPVSSSRFLQLAEGNRSTLLPHLGKALRSEGLFKILIREFFREKYPIVRKGCNFLRMVTDIDVLYR